MQTYHNRLWASALLINLLSTSSYQLTVCRRDQQEACTKCKAHAEGSVRHTAPHSCTPLYPSRPINGDVWTPDSDHSLLPSGALRETGYCSFWKQLCLCHWSLTYIPSASKFPSPEEQQHHLPLKAALSDKPQSPLSGNRKQLRSVSTGTHEHPSFSMTLAELLQLPWARTTTAQYQLQSEFSILLWRVTTETPLRWLELHKPSPPLLKHGHPSSHHTNPPSLQY